VAEKVKGCVEKTKTRGLKRKAQIPGLETKGNTPEGHISSQLEGGGRRGSGMTRGAKTGGGPIGTVRQSEEAEG